MTTSKKKQLDIAAIFATIPEGKRVANYNDKEVIYRQGDPCGAIFYLLEGEVKLTVTSEDGKEAVVSILQSGSFFGDCCLGGEPMRLTTAVAFQRASVLCVRKDAMWRLLQESSALLEIFVSFLVSRRIRMQEHLVEQIVYSAEKRLGRRLLLLAHLGTEGQDGPEAAFPKINHETLAEMVGTTRPRISFFMNKFRRLGLIDYDKGLQVNKALLDFLLDDGPEPAPLVHKSSVNLKKSA